MSVVVDSSSVIDRLHTIGMEAVERINEEFVGRARQRCSRRDGELVDSIEATSPVDEGTRITSTIAANAEHARYQDEGTGIYGPEGTRIYPTNGNVLVFDWPTAGGIVFATSVAGAPGTHFWELTVDEFPEIVSSV